MKHAPERNLLAPATELPKGFDPSINAVDNAIDLLIRNRNSIDTLVFAAARGVNEKDEALTDEEGDSVAIMIRSSHPKAGRFERLACECSPTIEGLAAIVARRLKFDDQGTRSGNPIDEIMRAMSEHG